MNEYMYSCDLAFNWSAQAKAMRRVPMTKPRFTNLLFAAVALAVVLSVFPTRAADAVNYSFTVASQYGEPQPEVGIRVYQSGSMVFASVNEYVQMSKGVRMYCSGWTGSGSVAAAGNTNATNFEIEANSTLTWLWETHYELVINCTYDIPSIPPLGSRYYPVGETINLGAPLFLRNLLYDGYSGTGEISSGSAHFLTFNLDSPSTITWFYRVSTLTDTPVFEGDAVTVDSAPEVGKYSSLAYNPYNGFPAVSYSDDKNGHLKYAYFDGAAWVIEEVDKSLLVGRFTKLIFDSTNSPVILYYGHGYRDLHIARKDIEGNWYSDIVDSDNFVGKYCDLTNLPGERFAVSYYDETNGNLLYREYRNGFWTPEPHLILDDGGTGGNVGRFSAIAANPISGEPGVAYRSDTDDCVYFIFRKEGVWIKQKVTNIAGTGFFIDLAYDANGTPYIVFQDYKNAPRTIDVMMAQQAGNTWITRTVQAEGDVGFYNSLSIDTNGFPHISYYDDSSRGLRYTFWNGRFWVTKLLDSDGDHVGRFCSLAFDGSGLPGIAYWADGLLRFFKADGWGEPVSVPPVPSINVRDTSGGGCFVATVAFGSYSQANVISLCEWRDDCPAATLTGTGILMLYYRMSPSVSKDIAATSAVRCVLRRFLKDCR